MAQFTYRDMRAILTGGTGFIRFTCWRSKIELRPLLHDDPRRRRPGITDVKATLGWEQTVALEDSLARMIAYFRQRLAA